MVCHGEHTYLYSQVMMNILAQEQKGGSNIRRICQELQKCANDRYTVVLYLGDIVVQIYMLYE